MINSDFGSDNVESNSPTVEETNRGRCFYTLCEKTKLCSVIPCGKFKDRKHALYCYVFTAMTICLLIAVIAPLLLYTIANSVINEEVVIDSTSAPNYDAWQTNAHGTGAEHVQIKYNLYYFEVQNMEEALNGERPKLMQVGPYAYDEYYVKFDITWTDGGDTVTYGTQKYYIFNQEETGPGLSESDEIVLPYSTVAGFTYLLGTVPEQQQEMIDHAIYGELNEKHGELITALDTLYYVVSHNPDIPLPEKVIIRNKIISTNETVDYLFNSLYEFVATSDVGDLLLKTLMCKLGNLTPFWSVNQFEAWFGWLNDPLLLEVQVILDGMANKSANGTVVPWTTGVPGASTNWTSVEDTRRRRAPDTFKTGKKNPNQVGQYVRYNNMTDLWTCVVPMDSQNTSLYTEGEQFAACELFQYEWTEQEAYDKGYRRPFATDYANRIWGTDANAFGRPITSSKLAVFISDIYRSCYLQYSQDEDWNGVTTRRFNIQPKDLENSTANPVNAQFYAFGPSGMENTTAATGVPVFVSFPHFLHGDTRLVSAVEGLNPNDAEHESNLDMEPQTGLLTQAHKRLQVNYQMINKKFPQTNPEDINLATSLCSNFSQIIELVDQFGNMTLPVPNCTLTVFTELFTCFGTPMDWKFYNDEIFFPYGWADEHFKLPDSDADDVHDSLFFIQDLAHQTQFWALIAAGILFTVILAMLYRGHLDMLARGETVWHAFDETSPSGVESELHDPISQPRAGAAYMNSKGAEPFLK